MLSAFRMNGSPYVFAALDRPAVVHEHNGKLVFSPLNESNLTHLCTFSTEAFPGAIAMCKDDRLMITAIDAIQRLHIRCGSMHWFDATGLTIAYLACNVGCQTAFPYVATVLH